MRRGLEKRDVVAEDRKLQELEAGTDHEAENQEEEEVEDEMGQPVEDFPNARRHELTFASPKLLHLEKAQRAGWNQGQRADHQQDESEHRPDLPLQRLHSLLLPQGADLCAHFLPP